MKKYSKIVGEDTYNTVITFLSRILSFSVSLIFKVLFARFVSVEANGIYGKWIASYNFGIIAFSLGLNLSIIYFCKAGKLKFSTAFTVNFLAYLILTLVLCLLSLLFGNTVYYLTLAVSIFFGLLLGSLNSIQLAKNNVRVFNLTELTRNGVVFLLGIMALVSFHGNLNFQYLSYLLSLFLTFIIFKVVNRSELFDTSNLTSVGKDYFNYGFKGTILNVLGQSLYIVDIYIIEYIAGPKYLGLYVVAGTIARLLWFFVDAGGTIIFPKLVNGMNEIENKNILYKLSTFSFLLNLVGLVGFAIVGKFFIKITFGPEYIESYSTIVVLLLASQGMVFYKLVNRYLSAKNIWKLSYIVLIGSVTVNVILNYLLIAEYHILGAAIASLISYWLCGIWIAKSAGFSIKNLLFYKLTFSK